MFDENSNNVMAMVNHLMNVKDSRWLQVEVCREFQRGQCSRTDQECKFAHPPPHVEVQNGKVTACYDSIKSRCNRENPKCKYLHPPQHLKDQLLINGRNNLALKNLLMSQLSNPNPLQGQLISPTLVPGLAGVQQAAAYPFYSPTATLNPAVGTIYPGLIPTAASPDAFAQYQSIGGVMPAGPAVSPASLAAATAAAQAQQKARTDRVEVCREFLRGSCQRPESECRYGHPPPEVDRGTDGSVTVCMDFVRGVGREGSCLRSPCRYFHPPAHLLAAVRAKMLQNQNGLDAAPLSPVGGGGFVNGNSQQHVAHIPVSASLAVAAAHAVAASAAAANQSSTAAGIMTNAGPSTSASVSTLIGSHVTGAGTNHVAGKKRPLEPDEVASASLQGLQIQTAARLQQSQAQAQAAALAAGDPLLLAAALQQQQQQQQQQQANAVKRVAVEKSGVPVYQPAALQPATPVQYHTAAQLAAIPGLQGAAYIPVSFAGGSGATIGAANLAAQSSQLAALPGTRIPNNSASVAYYDESGQLLDTIPVCRDFKQGHCERPNCRYVHLLEDYVEIHDGKVTVCRDFAKGKCTRVMCKYYHVPILSGSLLLHTQLAQQGSHQSVLPQLHQQPQISADPSASALAFLTQPTGMELLLATQQQHQQGPQPQTQFSIVSSQSCNA